MIESKQIKKFIDKIINNYNLKNKNYLYNKFKEDLLNNLIFYFINNEILLNEKVFLNLKKLKFNFLIYNNKIILKKRIFEFNKLNEIKNFNNYILILINKLNINLFQFKNDINNEFGDKSYIFINNLINEDINGFDNIFFGYNVEKTFNKLYKKQIENKIKLKLKKLNFEEETNKYLFKYIIKKIEFENNIIKNEDII